MSLDTVLQIGKVLRSSENSLKYFKYVEPCPMDKKTGEWPICITIPVNLDFSFDWKEIKITQENTRSDLYYLKFKTSDNDGLVKYVFGDIYYEKLATIKNDGSIESSEGGYYRLDNPNHPNAAYRPSSFNRGISDYKDIVNLQKDSVSYMIQQFHESFKTNINYIERILKYIPAILYYFENKNDIKIMDFLEDEENLYSITIVQNRMKISNASLKKAKIPAELSLMNEEQKRLLFNHINSSIFIHFEFSEKQHWYQFAEDMDLLNVKILSEFIDKTPEGLVLKKTLYKTLCSGDNKNDIQFPSFRKVNRYKSKSFQNDSLQDLFYAIEYCSKGKTISGTNIKLIVLPRGECLTSEDYNNFLDKRNEAQIIAKNKTNNHNPTDALFNFLSDNEKNITSFDLIFCKIGGKSTPDSDLIELSGLEKSKLRQTKERIQRISLEIYQEKKGFLKTDKDLSPLSIDYSFRNILGSPQTDLKTGKTSYQPNPKFQSHLLKILPLIYLDIYFHDEVLLPSFIQNVEFSIRSGDEQYSFLKYDLKFLLKIQNSQINKFKNMIESPSYQIGLKLGKLSKPLKKKINSFEKRYVGLLTRHVSTKDDCIKFTNEVIEMLTRHEKTWGNMSAEVCNQLAQLPLSDYDKEKLAFGFFEGYFKYEVSDKRKDFFLRLEKLLSDYEGNVNLETEVECISEVFNKINN